MADDNFLQPMQPTSGVPFGYMTPQQQLAYMQLQMRNRQRSEQNLSAYRSPLAAVGDMAETFANQLQLRRIMQGAQNQGAASAAAVPSLPDIGDDSSPAPSSSDDQGGGGSVPASIRNNNPGAQWPGPSADQFGSTGSQDLPG